VRPACTALGTVVCEDVHQRHAIVGSSSRENVQQMCRLLHCGSVLVATEFVTLRRCMSDGCADRAQIALQMRQCDLRIVRET